MQQLLTSGAWSPYSVSFGVSRVIDGMAEVAFTYTDAEEFARNVHSFITANVPSGVSADGTTPIFRLVGYHASDTIRKFELCYYVKEFHYTNPPRLFLEVFSIFLPMEFRGLGFGTWIFMWLEHVARLSQVPYMSIKAISTRAMGYMARKMGFKPVGGMVQVKRLIPSDIIPPTRPLPIERRYGPDEYDEEDSGSDSVGGGAKGKRGAKCSSRSRSIGRQCNTKNYRHKTTHRRKPYPNTLRRYIIRRIINNNTNI